MYLGDLRLTEDRQDLVTPCLMLQSSGVECLVFAGQQSGAEGSIKLAANW